MVMVRAELAGGLINWYGTVIISNTNFIDNKAYSIGGDIYNGFGNVTIYNSTFINNSARDGGRIL